MVLKLHRLLTHSNLDYAQLRRADEHLAQASVATKNPSAERLVVLHKTRRARDI